MVIGFYGRFHERSPPLLPRIWIVWRGLWAILRRGNGNRSRNKRRMIGTGEGFVAGKDGK